MRTRTAILAAAALAMLPLSGCGGDSADDATGKDGSASASTPDDDDAPAPKENTGKGAAVAVKAMDTAEANVRNGRVLDVELGEDYGNTRWELTILVDDKAQYELKVAADGEQVKSNVQDDDADDLKQDAARLDGAKLTAQDAAERAAADHPGDVIAVELEDRDDGATGWQVTLNDDGAVTEYLLDAKSGDTEASGRPED